LFRWHNLLPSQFFSLSIGEQKFILASLEIEVEEKKKENGK